jgi:hypothetical protein
MPVGTVVMPPIEAPETTMDFHPQDWILVVEALTAYSRDWEEIEPDRSQRTDELIEAIANEQGISSPELIRQIDNNWSG